jgi:hypothetical protein
VNKYDQLVADLLSGDLSVRMVGLAIQSYIRRRNEIPEGVKSLVCNVNSGNGLIGSMFELLQEIIGRMELSYRRGMQEGEDRCNNKGGE